MYSCLFFALLLFMLGCETQTIKINAAILFYNKKLWYDVFFYYWMNSHFIPIFIFCCSDNEHHYKTDAIKWMIHSEYNLIKCNYTTELKNLKSERLCHR